MRSIHALSVALLAGSAMILGVAPGCATGLDVNAGTEVTPDFGATPCVNLRCKKVACATGTTTISGTVKTPGLGDPVYNAIVYIPNGPVQPFAKEVTCDRCGKITGSPVATALTGADGRFVLHDVPAGADIPLVVQVGRWRRQVTISNVEACAETRVDAALTHLPRNQAEGDIPLHAVATGDADAMECVLRKMGIADSEFTIPSGPGRIHLYRRNGATLPGIPDASLLTDDVETLKKYDLVVFDCEGASKEKPVDAQQRLVEYTAAGGRVFASHYSYTWLYNVAPFSGTATWNVDQAAPSRPGFVGTIDTSFPKGQAFEAWMSYVGALHAPKKVEIYEPRSDAVGVIAPAQRWIYTDSPNTLQHYTFNAPADAPPESQCGRVVFSDFHVTAFDSASNAGDFTFPAQCTKGPMSPQEKVLEFMLLDLASCIQDDDSAPRPPK